TIRVPLRGTSDRWSILSRERLVCFRSAPSGMPPGPRDTNQLGCAHVGEDMETFRGSIDWVDALTAYSKKTRFGLARNRIHSAFSVRLCAPNIPKAPSLPEGPVPTRRTCPYPKDLSLPEGPVPTRKTCPYPKGLSL